MTEVAHPPYEPGPLGHSEHGRSHDYNSQELDWAVERDSEDDQSEEVESSNKQAAISEPIEDDHDRDEEYRPESVTASEDQVKTSSMSAPEGEEEQSDDSSSHSHRDDEEKEDRRKKYDTPYPRLKSPPGSPRHTHPGTEKQESSGEAWSYMERPMSASSQDEEDYEDDDTFQMTEDQKLAMKELQEMKLDLGYAADEDPPEYDVAERVRQLNEELANDPTPIEDDRERAIKFKPDLVDLVAPPPDVSESEEENATENNAGGHTATGTANATGSGNSTSASAADGTGSVQNGGDGGDSGDRGDEDDSEKILVHRDGKFELLSAKELTAEEKLMYLGGDEQSGDSENTPRSTESAPEISDSHEPSPPPHPRPRTAMSAGGRRNGRGQRQNDNSSRRAHSAEPQLNANRDYEDFNYQSPYAMTSDERKRKAREQREKEKQEKKDEENKKKEEEKRKEDSESAFNAWLKKKKDEAVKRREQEKKKKQNEEEEEDDYGKNAFNEWKEEKKKQQQQEKQAEQKRREEEERDRTWGTRTQQECDKAFKQWLRKKYQQAQDERRKELHHTRIGRLMARRCRKSLALARAISQAQSFRYMDFYGYRF